MYVIYEYEAQTEILVYLAQVRAQNNSLAMDRFITAILVYQTTIKDLIFGSSNVKGKRCIPTLFVVVVVVGKLRKCLGGFSELCALDEWLKKCGVRRLFVFFLFRFLTRLRQPVRVYESEIAVLSTVLLKLAGSKEGPLVAAHNTSNKSNTRDLV